MAAGHPNNETTVHGWLLSLFGLMPLSQCNSMIGIHLVRPRRWYMESTLCHALLIDVEGLRWSAGAWFPKHKACARPLAALKDHRRYHLAELWSFKGPAEA